VRLPPMRCRRIGEATNVNEIKDSAGATRQIADILLVTNSLALDSANIFPVPVRAAVSVKDMRSVSDLTMDSLLGRSRMMEFSVFARSSVESIEHSRLVDLLRLGLSA
jgi:hypothetical protein